MTRWKDPIVGPPPMTPAPRSAGIVDPQICTGSMMCPLHEHQTALVMQEVRETCELLDEALGERNRYREQARHWKTVAGLAMTALAGLFMLTLVGFIR